MNAATLYAQGFSHAEDENEEELEELYEKGYSGSSIGGSVPQYNMAEKYFKLCMAQVTG